MTQNFLRSPKKKILAVAPKARCVRDWGRGTYRIEFGKEVTDFNGRTITSINCGTLNPADAWFSAVVELRLI